VPGLDDFQVAVTRARPGDPLAEDVLEVRALASPAGQPLAERVVGAVRAACEVRPHVLLLAAPEFARLRGPYKFRRFVDERPNPED